MLFVFCGASVLGAVLHATGRRELQRRRQLQGQRRDGNGAGNSGGEKVKLTYFRGRGLAEAVRWMLAAGNVSFEQRALEEHEEFLQLREGGQLLFGQLPLLEIDGLKLVNSIAMVLYVAKRGGLYPEDDKEAALAVAAYGCSKDFVRPLISRPFAIKDGETVAACDENLLRCFEKFAPRFEKMISSNGGRWLVGRKMSFADVAVAEVLQWYIEVKPQILSNFPLLERLHSHVVQLRGVADYLSSSRRWPVPSDAYVNNVRRVLHNK
eukprot:g3106.t1